MIGIERQFRKWIEAMDEKVEIKKQDFYEMMYLMEKILYIAERSGAREDSDNNAYSLAITFGKENVVHDLLSLRRKMNDYLDAQGEAELEKILEPIDDITIPYGLTLEALREELERYLPKKVEG
jgi:probable transcriptional regulator yvfI